MLPIAIIPVIEAAVSAKTVEQLIKFLPTIQQAIAPIMNQPDVDWSENDLRLIQGLANNFQQLVLKSSDKLQEDLLSFQKLSHQNQLDFIAKFDLTKLSSSDTAAVIKSKIENESKISIWGMLIKGTVAVVGILAAAEAMTQQQKNSYNLKRPRSISEKIFGDKK